MLQQGGSSSSFGSLGQLGQRWAQAWEDASTTITQAVQESPAVQAVQEKATRVCCVCQQRALLTNVATCEECKRPVCKTGKGCIAYVHVFTPGGLSTMSNPGVQLQPCQNCFRAVQDRARISNVKERQKRAASYFAGTLEPYMYSPESKLEKSFRLGGHVMETAKWVADILPLGKAVHAVSAGYYIIRYGPLVLCGNDVIDALQLLVGLAGKLDSATVIRAKAKPDELFGGFYYMMGEHVGERGKAPELERLQHVGPSGDVPAPDRELLLRLRRLARLPSAGYSSEPTPTDAQRFFKQALPGSELVLAELLHSQDVPSYFLVATRRDKQVYLVLPGTRNTAHIATDLNVCGEEIEGKGVAHKGVAQMARWLMAELSPVMVNFHAKGYQVTVVGHSLGAGVGAVFTALLQPMIRSMYCYGFGTPACVDERLSFALLDCMTSVVNHDDMVPRLTLQSVQRLVDFTLSEGQRAKTKAWMDEDWRAVKDVERVVELRRRGAPAPSGLAGPGSDAEKIERLREAGVPREAAGRALAAEGGDLTRALLRATTEELALQERPQERPQEAAAGAAGGPGDAPARQESYVSQQSRRLLGDLQRMGTARLEEAGRQVQDWTSDLVTRAASATTASNSGQQDDHPLFFVPGKIIHLYSHNGLARAAFAEPTHETLAHIQPSQQMLEDHKLVSYDEALRQACAVDARPPRWESFEERKKCACCGADFNWAFVLQSEPQRMLARHHCHKCGRVVCEGCSENRAAQPQLGFAQPVRTCDACMWAVEDA